MNTYRVIAPRIVGIRAFAFLTLALVLVSLTLVMPARPASAPRVQPALLQYVAQHPSATVDVIIRPLGSTSTAKQAITSMGGTITGDLRLINALTARIATAAVVALGQAAGVGWISLDAPMHPSVCTPCIDTSRLRSALIPTIGADQVWNEAPKYLQGQGISVAVIDSGINPQQDLYTTQGVSRLVASVAYNSGYNQSVYDGYGHGNHVAGIIGGSGSRSGGAYIGVAPAVNLINVKVTEDQGSAAMSNVIHGLQWVYENKDRYNIRVVNLSMNSSVAESYHVNPLDAALEVLWFNKIVVVVSAGNNASTGVLYPPANDPFVITVGATDDKGTPSRADDTLASFSAYGVTQEGIVKPDLVAPGSSIVSLMANPNSVLALGHPSNVVDTIYFRMSGTSMAAPVVAGAVALLLQDEPTLTPHQVKYRLRATARPFDTPARAGAGYLDVAAAINGTTTQTANNGIGPSKLAWQWAGGDIASWNSVNWSSVNWSSVNWSSDYWGNQ
jgi:serine protease AprX